MDLVNAVSEFMAAIFARFGYVGRSRRRANIRDDIALLDLVRSPGPFGPTSSAAKILQDHIYREIAHYSGVELRRKRKVPWGTVVISLGLGLLLAYWTYWLDQDGFSLLSLLPGAGAAFFLVGGLGVLFSGDRSEESAEPTQPAA